MMDNLDNDDDSVPVGSIWNVPNLVTLARIDLTIGCFVCLAVGWYRAAFVLFVVAAGTDWLDGWWARRYNQITQIGRVLDPFADKLLICGVFIFLAAVPGSRIVAWMAVLVLGRELLVTALRSFVESQGGDFSAKWIGKQKMVWQCAAAGLSLLLISPWWDVVTLSPWMVDLAVWVSLVLTLLSGWMYLAAAIRMLSRTADEEASLAQRT